MRKLTVGIVLAAALAGNAMASIIFTDDFSGEGSGTGWSDTWSAGTISDGSINVPNTTSFRELTTNMDPQDVDFWFVSNLKMNGNSGNWVGLSFFNGGTEDLFFGMDGGTTTWEFDTRAMGDQTSSVPVLFGVNQLLIAHVTAGSIDMWIDPADTSSESALGTADKSYSGNTSDESAWTRIRIGTNMSGVEVFDMTAATTFGEAIPEPTTLGMLALAGGGLLFIRRKLAM